MNYIYLLIGFALLIKGADFFVNGSSLLAKRLKISPLIIGLTIVAFGTSAPEAAVSFQAAINGYPGIALGNVIGSNLINTTLIVGVLSAITAIRVDKQTIIRQIPFVLISTIVVLILMIDIFSIHPDIKMFSRIDGIILLILFIFFVIYILRIGKKKDFSVEDNTLNLKEKPLYLTTFFIILGLAGIIFGGQLVLDNSVVIAQKLGISETLIGLTIVAFGTSLPELVTSIVAAVKKQNQMALGNIIGSNIFNILFILGVSSVIQPIVIQNGYVIDTLVMIIFTSILLFYAITHKNTITRGEGISLVGIYLAYLTYIFIR